MKKTRGMIEVVSITVYYFRCNVCGRYIHALTKAQATQYATVHLKTQHNINADVEVKERIVSLEAPNVELGKVVGGEDIYIRLVGEKRDYWIYLTPEGRLWGQYCLHEDSSKCDDGIDLSVKDVYEMLVKAFRG